MKSDPEIKDGIVEYSMGYYADEFGKVLNGPFSGEQSPFDCEEICRHHWRIDYPGAEFALHVRVVEQPPRKLGLFNLPVLQVRFDFGSTAADLRAEFFGRFHQYFHKGGG